MLFTSGICGNRRSVHRKFPLNIFRMPSGIFGIWSLREREREKLIPKFPLTAAELLMAKNLKCEKKGIRCETNIGAPKCHLASLNSFCCCIYVMALVIALFIFRSDRLVSERSCHVFPNGEVKFTLPSIIGTPARRGWFIPHPCFCIFFLFSGYSDRVQAKGQLSASTPRAGSEFVYKCRGSLVILYRFTSTRPVRGRLCSVASSTQKKMIYISMNCERNEILGEEAEQVIPIVQGEKTKKTKQKKQCKRSHRWRICICTPPCYFPTLVKNKKSFFNVLHAALATAPLLHLSSVFSFRLYFELEASFLSR